MVAFVGCALVVLATIWKHNINVYTTVHNPSGFLTNSERHAKRHGIWVDSLVVDPAEFAIGGTPLRVKEAWIEKRSEVVYPFVWLWHVRPTSEYRVKLLFEGDVYHPYIVLSFVRAPRSFSKSRKMFFTTVREVPERFVVEVHVGSLKYMELRIRRQSLALSSADRMDGGMIRQDR